MVPSGGRTGLAGAAAATNGEVVVSLERLNRVHEIDVASRRMRVDAGVTLEQAQLAAAERGLLYPVDYAAKGTAQIGGSIATNAGGVKVLRYGLTREWVAGMDVVLADGSLLQLTGELDKNNTGYDLRQLFIGSEGTLGFVARATLRLTSPPQGVVVALASLPSETAILDLFGRLRATPLLLSAFECFDAGCVEKVLAHRGSDGRGPFEQLGASHVLVEVELPTADAEEVTRDDLMLALADAQEAGEILDAVVAQTDSQASELWNWREEISESLHLHTPHKADVSIPIGTIAAFLQRWRSEVSNALPEVLALCFGHVGDGNLHLNLLRPEGWSLERFLERCHAFDDTAYGLVESFGGSVSAEHGIGLLKRNHLHHTRSAAEIEIMRGIKSVLDPKGLLNPGKIFTPAGS